TLANRQGHLVLQLTDVLQRLAITNRAEQALVPFGKVGLDANQEHRHARNDRKRRKKARQVVEHRRAQRADHLIGRRRVEPEDELVDPDTQVVAEPGGQQAEEYLAPVEEVEGDQSIRTVLAQDVVEKHEQQAG